MPYARFLSGAVPAGAHPSTWPWQDAVWSENGTFSDVTNGQSYRAVFVTAPSPEIVLEGEAPPAPALWQIEASNGIASVLSAPAVPAAPIILSTGDGLAVIQE